MSQAPRVSAIANRATGGDDLFARQVDGLRHAHFLLLYWAAQAEDRQLPYNMTNAFDDLKAAGITRTKQNAVAFVDALAALCFLEIRDESNRKNLYITTYGAQALQQLIATRDFTFQPSYFLGGAS